MTFNEWFEEKDMPIPIQLYAIRCGFILKEEMTPILKEGSKFAWDYLEKERNEYEMREDLLKKEIADLKLLVKKLDRALILFWMKIPAKSFDSEKEFNHYEDLVHNLTSNKYV